MENYMDLNQLETDLEAENQAAIMRYMTDVTHVCLEKVSEADKETLLKSFQDGEELPDTSYVDEGLFLNIAENLKTLEDLRIPEEQLGTTNRTNANVNKFRSSLEKNKRTANNKKNGLGILGFNIDGVSNTTKAIYALIIIGVIGFFLNKASSILFREDTSNPKHQRPKKKAKKGRKKAKTT